MNKKIVLIAEDDFIIQLFISRVLRSLGIEQVYEVSDGKTALSILDSLKPDFAIIDVGLSGVIDGIELACRMNQKNRIPFVFLSGNSDESTFRRAMAENPMLFLKKPIDEDRLTVELNRILSCIEKTD